MTTAAARILLLTLVLFWTGIPFLALLLLSLGGEWFWPALVPRTFDLSRWTGLLGGAPDSRLARAGWISLLLAVGTGALASALALPVGRALARLRGWRRALGAGAAFLPVAVPPIALGIGLQYTFLRLGLAGSLGGVLLAHLVPALGYASLFFLGVFAVYDERVEEEARSLGASPWQVTRFVTLPLLRRPLAEVFVLGFLVSWAQVPLTLLVGQGLVTTLSVEVLSYVQAGQDGLAATGALLLILPPIALLSLVALAVRRTVAVAV